MKRYLLFKIISLLIISNQTSILSTTAFQIYLNQEAQKIVNNFYRQSKIDGTKALLVCSFLNNNKELATFPANTYVSICNRQYIKTQDALCGNWCIVLPEERTTPKSSLTVKPKFIFIPDKQSLPALTLKKQFSRSSKRRRDD